MTAVKQIQREREKLTKQKTEMADAHCHLDLIYDNSLIESAIENGVLTMVTNGIDTKSNVRALELCDGKNIFGALGIDPASALLIDENELDDQIDFNISLIKANRQRVVAIGEIGLDYMRAKEPRQVMLQKKVFARFLDLAKDMNMPVSVHSRESMPEVLSILKEREMQKVHLHFFEGNAQQAKSAERNGYMISIPPLESTKRKNIIKELAIDSMMVESDAPVIGQTPRDIENAIRYIAMIKGLTFERAAETLTDNTKRFFRISNKLGFMRS